MRPASILATSLLAAAGAMALADAAAAQSAQRQLTWAGRPEASAAIDTAVPVSVSAGRPRRPNPVIPHGGMAAADAPPAGLASGPAAPRRTLTPANAWLRPPQPQPEPQPQPAPPPVRPTVMATDTPVPPQPRATPDFLPDQGGRGQPVPAEIALAAPPPQPQPQPQPSMADPADPMAPRRDAPIFRMQRDQPAPQPEPQASEAAPVVAPARADADARTPQPRRVAEVTRTDERPAPWTGARYYSVHRQNGRQPDALALPQPTYVDALAVTMTETPASQDLAQPDQGPTLIRDNQGRLRAAPTASDGDHQ